VDGLNNNQENQQWGGKREGAGRPKGTGHKPKMVDDLTDDQKQSLLTTSLAKALEGDSRLSVFFLEQIYGKARQNVGIDGGDEGLPVLISEIIARKNDINTSPE